MVDRRVSVFPVTSCPLQTARTKLASRVRPQDTCKATMLKKMPTTRILIFAITALLMVAGFVLHVGWPSDSTDSGTQRVAKMRHPAISPSGRFVLSLVRDPSSAAKAVRFTISAVDQDRERIVFTSSKNFSARHNAIFMWGDDDIVWVYSSDDAEVYCWTPIEMHDWVLGELQDLQLPVPDSIWRKLTAGMKRRIPTACHPKVSPPK
jgi:hypothetical protein